MFFMSSGPKLRGKTLGIWLSLEEYALSQSIAQEEDRAESKMGSRVLVPWMEAWIAEHPQKERGVRLRAETLLEEIRDPGGGTPPGHSSGVRKRSASR